MSGDPVGGGAAQQAARAELRRAEYHRGGPSLVQRVVDWFGRRIGDLFAGGTSSSVLLVVLVLVIAVAIVFAARAGVPRRRARSAATGDLLAPDPDTNHRAAALDLAAQGRRDEALREWLREAIRTIERRGVLAPRPGRTGAATAREAGPLLPDAAAELGAATTAFDEVWFGGRAATDADVAAGAAAADAVLRAPVAAVTAPGGLAVPR